MKKLLSLVCVLTLLLALVPSLAAPVSAETRKTLYHEILERDGFIEGVWFPWFTHDNLGCGLTTNEVAAKYITNAWYDFKKVGIDSYGADKIYREIYNLKALGFNIMGYEGSPLSEGVVFDEYGNVLGVKQDYLKNIRRLLNICREVGMPVLWTLTMHSTVSSEYWENGKLAWDITAQAYANPKVADQYAKNFITPVCKVLAEYPDVVKMVSVGIELENEINDSEIGNYFDHRFMYGVEQEPMLYFINAVTEAAKKNLPDVSRVIGSTSHDFTIYEGIDFDFLGVNNYNINSRVPEIDDMKATLPMLGTEFGFGDGVEIEDEVWTIKQIRFRDNFIEEGYKGWFYWCWSATGFGGAYDLLAADGKSQTDFRAGAFTIKYNADNYRAEHRGEEIILDKPVLFCNTGSGRVEWVASRQAESLTIERSYDGGKTWTVIAENLAPADYEKNFKGTYIDEEVANCTTGGTVCYRVTADDGWGEKAVSEPNNVAEIVGPPINVFKDLNCSFETGDLTDWLDWGTNTATSADGSGNYFAQVVEMEDATNGKYVLEFQYVDGEWFGIHIDGIDVKPNTNYVISYDYKIADPEKDYMTGYFFIRGFVGDGSGDGSGSGSYCDDHLASKWLNSGSTTEWTREEISYKTNGDKLGLDLRVIKGVHYYIDNIEMYEVR